MLNKSAPTTEAAPVIELRGLTVRRGRRDILRDLDLSIPAAEVVGLLGPSGCGKSTLMRSIVGVQKITAGTITVLGLGAGTPSLRHRVGYVTQSASVYDDLTVEQNIAYFSRIIGAPPGDIERVITTTDLVPYARQLVGSLSGGQRSRVSLAAALLGSPNLLVLDEPTVGLDPVLRADLWSMFRNLAADGTGLLISSHVMDEATRCDRLLLMRDGSILADLTPAELLESTGTTSADEAFLTLIEHAAGADASSLGEAGRPTHARRRIGTP